MCRAVLIAAAAGVALTGCGTSDDRRDARRAAERMYAAAQAKDGAAACVQLTEAAREALEQQAERPCEEAILGLELVGSRTAGVKVFLTSAEALFAEGDVVFLDRTSLGWRVSAAGCQPRAGRPADCELES